MCARRYDLRAWDLGDHGEMCGGRSRHRRGDCLTPQGHLGSKCLGGICILLDLIDSIWLRQLLTSSRPVGYSLDAKLERFETFWELVNQLLLDGKPFSLFLFRHVDGCQQLRSFGAPQKLFWLEFGARGDRILVLA